MFFTDLFEIRHTIVEFGCIPATGFVLLVVARDYQKSTMLEESVSATV
jgi:hypothetical protein